jgi:S-adenosylmethionine:tRNA ribosyltransferase-isomerase
MRITLNEYTYPLPADRIAAYPLNERDQSKLLIYDSNSRNIKHEQFASLADHLPENSLLIFNDTKVIPARLHFQKDSGAEIEIFLLNPIVPSPLVAEAMLAEKSCTWKCTIGNLKKWKEGTSLTKELQGISIQATLQNKDEAHVAFTWNTTHHFAEIVNQLGETPLPPYLKRKAVQSDRERYQTIYSHYEGAVAAPTAGLHFTEKVFTSLKTKNIQTDFVTLHVSAGTFQPIKVENVREHIMHNEQVIVSRRNIENILQSDFVIPVGTTSLRTLESLYWYGVKLLRDPLSAFDISQHDTYETSGTLPSGKEALEAIISFTDNHKKNSIQGETSLYILPGYTFRICKALITNFHQPGSTLLLLVSAFIGEDWKKVYAEALENQYRFLSYGDSSLLIADSTNYVKPL